MTNGDNSVVHLTIREEIAARAMQGILSNLHLIERYRATSVQIAEAAVIEADALIAELNKTKET